MQRIHGILKTTSPLHISDAEGAYYNPTTHQFGFAKAAGFFPCTKTRKMPIAFRDNDSERGEDRGFIMVPDCPTNTWRGLVRRCAAHRILRAHAKRGHKLPLQVYYTLTAGASTGNPDSAAPTVAQIKTAASHVFMGVFGGGPKMHRSGLRVCGGLPICPATRDEFIPQEWKDYSISTNYPLARLFMRRVDDLARGVTEVAAGVIEDCDNVVQEWFSTITDKENSDVRGVTSVSIREVVVPGVPFYFNLEWEDLSEAQIGLILLALQDFANEQKLGGRRAIGFGHFAFQGMQYVENGNKVLIFNEETTPYTLNLDNPIIKSCVTEALEAIDNDDPVLLDAFATTEKVKEKPANAAKADKKGGEGVE